MPSVKYGNTSIQYTFQENSRLRSHYIIVERGKGVTLKGKPISSIKANALVLKKARWIIRKLELVRSIPDGDIVTGSRLLYLGRRYYVEVVIQAELSKATVLFNHSKFKIAVPEQVNVQALIETALADFYRGKAAEKISPRVRYWSERTGLSFNQLKFIYMEKRWGSCTPTNNIILNTEAIKLPITLIDYLIVHELCHVRVKNHSKEFWAEVARYLPNWRELDERMVGMGM